MWRVLEMDQQDVREVEIYSRIAPIAWDVPVSRPPETEPGPAPPDAGHEAAIAATLGGYFGSAKP